MDKAGASGSSEGVQSFMSMANSHQRNFKEAVHRYGVRKKTKLEVAGLSEYQI